MSRLEISLLGTFQIKRGSAPITKFESNKTRALLVYLALESDRPHRRDALAALLWPDSAQEAALNSLRNALVNLRRAIGDREANPPCLLITRETIQFNPDSDCHLDAAELINHDSSSQTDIQRRIAAVESYRGPFLEGFSIPDSATFEEWVGLWRERLERRMMEELHWLAEFYETRGEYASALVFARRQAALDPWMEEGHCRIMRLLALSGQREQALRQYHTLREILRKDLDAEPGENAANLYKEILSGSYPAVSAKDPPHNLPVQLTSFIGREKEIEALKQIILSSPTRLVTVTGAGGTGKTRLAQEAGRTLLAVFPDGVYLVELDARQAQETLAPLIARAVGLDPFAESGPFGSPTIHNLEERLFNFMQDKKLLLILDGFEGMLGETAWLGSLLRHTSGLVVLATSRIQMNLNAEQVFVLEGLSYPQQEAEMEGLTSSGAMQLFVDAGRRTRPDFTLNTVNRQGVAAICRVLQGMPLGILLAAAWMRILDPEQISGQLQRSLDFLKADWVDLPERQRSLRATFEYSLHLLGQAERTAFLRLSVFRGAFSAQRAGQVAELALPTLKILVDHSLLRPTGQGRFRIHELLRQYAQEVLVADPGEEWALRERHCQVFMTALADLEPRVKSSELFNALEEMDHEYPDFLEAWDWAAEHGYIRLLEPAIWALGRYQQIRNLFIEGAGLCEKGIDRLDREGIGPQNLRLWVRLGDLLANNYIRQTKFESCRQVLERVENALRAQPGLAAGLQREQAFLQITQGEYYRYSGGEYLRSLEFYQRGLGLMYGSEDPWDIGFGLMHVAGGQGQIGKKHENQHYTELGLETLRPSGDPILISNLLAMRGFSLMFSGQSEEAIRTVEELFSYRQRFTDHKIHNIPTMRGIVRLKAGLYQEARPLLEQGTALYNRPEDRERHFISLWLLDLTHLGTGNYGAIRLGPGISAEDQAGLEQTQYCKFTVPLIWGTLDLLQQDWVHAEQNFQSYCNHLKAVTRPHLMGTSLAFLGLTAYRSGDLHLARQRLIAALENGVEYEDFFTFCASLGILALMLAEAGELEQAVELYATATVHPAAGNARWFDDVLGKPIAHLVENLPSETTQTARARGRSRALAAAGQETLAKLKACTDLISGLCSE